MTSGYIDRLNYLRDVAIINQDAESVNKYNEKIELFFSEKNEHHLLNSKDSVETKSSRFAVRKQRPNVSRGASSMGYAKPVQNQRILEKYNCIVTGEKRSNPCAGCSNVQGCISNSMQYKEHVI